MQGAQNMMSFNHAGNNPNIFNSSAKIAGNFGVDFG